MSDEGKIIYKISELKRIRPVKYDVMEDEYETSNRFYKLQKGMEYGNRFNIKSIITLQTKQGEEKIKSHILKLDGGTIIVRGNIKIPIKSIKRVEFEL